MVRLRFLSKTYVYLPSCSGLIVVCSLTMKSSGTCLSFIVVNNRRNLYIGSERLKNVCACSSAWIEQSVPNRKIRGSNPRRRVMKKLVWLSGLGLYGVFVVLSWVLGVFRFYAIDALFFAGIITFLFFSYDFWRLNTRSYALIVLSLPLHLMGVFGWYNVSPLPFAWDHVTHAVPVGP